MNQPLDFAKIAKAIATAMETLNNEARAKEVTLYQLKEADRNWKQALSANIAAK